MDEIKGTKQTYSQAPWRTQYQLIGLFSLVVVSIAIVAGVYLHVSARAAAVGREIQKMQYEIEAIDLDIESSKSELAMILSTGEMERRAQALGFEPVDPENILYISVPGYVESQSETLAPSPHQRVVTGAPVKPPEYTESLFDWLRRQLAVLLARYSEELP